MFDELFPEATDTALTAKLNRPPEPQAPRFSTWGMLTAPPRGLTIGAAQAMGSTADMLGAYGSVMGATGGSGGGMFTLPTPDEHKQQLEAMDKLLTSGPDYMSAGGRSLRNAAESYTPDPITTHAAESAVINLFRMGGKAITAAATMGNIPGAIVAGAEEGFTIADQLAGQGVDIGTRTQVGAVNAAMNAAAFALPVAGKTWMQTGALALVGGPVSFVAQQAATREILQAADYTKQADQYDPFDPLGLALSTVIPLGFGALAMRGAKARAKAGEAAPIEPPVSHLADDVVDAARVSLIRQHMDSTNPVPGDIAAADAHVKAYTQAMEQMAAGERVSVEVPDALALRASEEMAARVKPMEAIQPVQIEIKPESNFMAAKSDAGLVGGHVTEGALRISTSEVSPDMRGQGEGIKLYTALIDDALAKGLRVFSDSTVEASAVRVYEALARRGYDVKRLDGGTLDDGAVYGKGATEPAFEVLAKSKPKAPEVPTNAAPVAMESVATPDMATYIAERGLKIPDAVDPAAAKGNAFISWLKGAGGVAWSQKVDIVGERGVRGNYAGIFTKNGQQLDTLVQSAVEAGYLTRADVDSANDNGGTRALAELIRRATTGEKIKTAESIQDLRVADAQTRADMDAADFIDRELQALGVDTTAARGSPEILSAYLADHRESLVNRRLADIDAETAQERIATGEAFNLSPKQIDEQSRIALAQELDENAVYDAAAGARDQVDFLNRIEEIIRNAPGSRETNQSSRGAAPDGRIPQGDGQAAATRSTDPASQPTNPTEARLNDIASRNPAAMDAEIATAFDDNGKPTESMTVREYLDQIKREAMADEQDAGLIEVAANCFLNGGL